MDAFVAVVFFNINKDENGEKLIFSVLLCLIVYLLLLCS